MRSRFHVDAAQSAGKLPLDLGSAPIDLCSLTAHKLCGPKGVGALYVAAGVVLTPQMHGGEQEHGLRAGTLATHQAVGMGKAYALADPKREAPRLAALRDCAVGSAARDPGARQNGDPQTGARRMYSTSRFRAPRARACVSRSATWPSPRARPAPPTAPRRRTC